MLRHWIVLGAALAALFGAEPARAYPEKPIQLMIAFPAGGATDVGARVAASLAEKILGQPIVVVNKVGAGGQVGWTDLARQRPDGYNIGLVNLPNLNTIILDPERKATFGLDAFKPIINQVLDPGLIWVKASSPYKTVGDLLEAAKKTPNTIRAATTGLLSDDHLAILMTEEAAPGAHFRIVHLAGSADQMKAILAGDVDVAFDNVGGGLVPRIKSGEVRALAVMDHERSKFLPDVPTMKELGYPSVISSSTRGFVAPKGTPDAVVQKLAAAFKQAMQDPEHTQKLEAAGLAVRMMEGAEYAKYYADTHETARKYTEWARSRPRN
jgi:tripartite-type tricarboxylate transporter receptor subunit TctC